VAEVVTHMIAETAQSSGVIWMWSGMTMNGCCATCCSTPTWLNQQMRDFQVWHGWHVKWLGPSLTMIVAADVDWLLRPETAQKQGMRVQSRKGTGKRVPLTRMLSVPAPVTKW